jgi:hypothetical protein
MVFQKGSTLTLSGASPVAASPTLHGYLPLTVEELVQSSDSGRRCDVAKKDDIDVPAQPRDHGLIATWANKL